MDAAYARYVDLIRTEDERPDPVFIEYVYHGPSYNTDRIESVLEDSRFDYERTDDFAETVAELLVGVT